MTIAGMIIVNTPGSWSYVYAPLRHAAWHGHHLADLVFPFFLWIMGVSMSVSFQKFKSLASGIFYRKVIKRSLLIFLAGLLLNAFPFYDKDYETLRWMGVLQRIAVVYFFSALAVYHLKWKELMWLLFFITIVYTLLLSNFGNGYELEESLLQWIDLKIIGADHMWKGLGVPFDPEGILSSFPAMINCILGFLFGWVLFRQQLSVKRLLALSFIVMGLSWSMSLFQPFNKYLWTPAFAWVTSAYASCIFLMIYVMVDVRKHTIWFQPFNWLGRNPLFIFILSIVWVKVYFRIRWEYEGDEVVNLYQFIYREGFASIAEPYGASFLFAFAHLLLFCWVANYLFRKEILIKM